MAAGPITTGSTVRFRLTATKDEAVWDITGATITLRLTDPDGNVSDLAASITTAASGIADYDCSTSTLDEAGKWTRQWKVVQSGVTLWSVPVEFWVAQGG